MKGRKSLARFIFSPEFVRAPSQLRQNFQVVGFSGQVSGFHRIHKEVVQLFVYRLLLEVSGVFVPCTSNTFVFGNLRMVEEMFDEKVASPSRR